MTKPTTALQSERSTGPSSTRRTRKKAIALGTAKMRLIPGQERWYRKISQLTAQGIAERKRDDLQLLLLSDVRLRYPRIGSKRETVNVTLRDVISAWWEGALVLEEDMRTTVLQLMARAKIPATGKKAVAPEHVIIEFHNLRG